MDRPQIAQVAFPLPIDRLFDYKIPKKFAAKVQKGSRVSLRFNNKLVIGYVASVGSKSKFPKLNPVLGVIDEGPVFSPSALRLAEKIKDYYVCSLGEAIEIMLPHALKPAKALKSAVIDQNEKVSTLKTLLFVRYSQSESILDFIKSEVSEKAKAKKRVILIVPEIRMIETLKNRLEEIAGLKVGVMHGQLSKKDALSLWEGLSLDSIDVVVGTRSAVFSQVKNLNSIIILGDDDYAYKEDQVPYYHALKVALMRSDISNCGIILAAQLPSLDSFHFMDGKKAIKNDLDSIKPSVKIQFTKVNFKDKIDVVLGNEIEAALEKKEKILILLDRKGFATSLFCRKCNETLRCSQCSCDLRLEYSQKILICPRCNHKQEATEICPKCNSGYVKYRGLGIEKLESNIKRQFPSAKIISLDQLKENMEFDIIISTRKIANSEEFKSDIAVIWDFDSMLNIGDFRSGEQAFQVLAKLMLKTNKKMIISTSLSPDFYLFKSLGQFDYEQFYREELKSRETLKLPPFYHLALVSVRSIKKENAQNTSSRLHEYFGKQNKKNLFVSEVSLKRRSKVRGKYYNYLLLKSKKVPLLNKAVKEGISKFKGGNVIITVDIDPLET